MSNKNVPGIGKRIGKQTAKDWVDKYQQRNPVQKNPNVKYGWLYGCDILHSMLKDEGCEGIWFYKGINDNNEECLVLYPANKEGGIIGKIKSLGAAAAMDGPEPADDGQACPPNCPD